MSKVTPVKWGVGNKDRGTFRADSFNLFDDDDRDKYAELRTRANNAANGITIESIREYTRKTVVCEQVGDEDGGQNLVTTTTEDIVLLVQYWEKQPEKKQGDTDDEVDEAQKVWHRGGVAAR